MLKTAFPLELFGYLGLEEFDYFATDSEGSVALFSSGGSGPIPKNILESFDKEEYSTIQDGMPIDDLPNISESTDLVNYSEDTYKYFEMPKEFAKLANKGFYIYNYNSYKKYYKLILKPTLPLQLYNLDSIFIEKFNYCKFNLKFSRKSEIS